MSEQLGPLAGRRIVVGVTGSIAAYKAVLVVRRLLEQGAIVDVAMTPAATQFVRPLTFASLTHRPVLSNVLALDAEQQIAHIDLAEAADAIVVAPATANAIAELAAGLERRRRRDRLRKPRAGGGRAGDGRRDVDPPATQRNVETLRSFGTSSSSPR